MKWNKLGKIFNPTDHYLSNNCVEFSQSPQVLIFDNFVRIYFSTRKTDEKSKYLSYISFVDMDKSFKKIINISSNTVIELGSLGCFDEHGIFPMNVIKVENNIFAYTTGWNRRVSVSTDAAIGLAVSYDNGVTFKKLYKGPILTSSLHEPFLIGDASVNLFHNTYHMWYIHGTKWVPNEPDGPERVYKIAHATSKDGILWHKENKQLISDKLNTNECQALPSVIYLQKKYHMFFCYRHVTDFRRNKTKSYRIGYAYSSDLINWIRDDKNVGIDVTENSWDSDMLCYPHVFEMNGDVYMLYNGNEFGRFGFGVAKLEISSLGEN